MAQHRAPQPRRRFVGYHLLVAILFGGVVLLAACTDDPAPAPMGPSVDEVTPAPEPAPEPIAPAEADPAPVSPAADPEPQVEVQADPEPAEDEPVHAGTIRDWVGPEHCATANDSPALTQAEWIEFCSPSLDADEAHTDGGDGWPDGAYEPAPDECIGYGCSPEQDAAINEAEAAANAGY
jgi:hypothetical protein